MANLPSKMFCSMPTMQVKTVLRISDWWRLAQPNWCRRGPPLRSQSPIGMNPTELMQALKHREYLKKQIPATKVFSWSNRRAISICNGRRRLCLTKSQQFQQPSPFMFLHGSSILRANALFLCTIVYILEIASSPNWCRKPKPRNAEDYSWSPENNIDKTHKSCFFHLDIF